jgi:hypothetical protein
MVLLFFWFMCADTVSYIVQQISVKISKKKPQNISGCRIKYNILVKIFSGIWPVPKFRAEIGQNSSFRQWAHIHFRPSLLFSQKKIATHDPGEPPPAPPRLLTTPPRSCLPHLPAGPRGRPVMLPHCPTSRHRCAAAVEQRPKVCSGWLGAGSGP